MSTLQNFGVPVDGSMGMGILQPKLSYRFRVTLQTFGNASTTTIFTRQVMNVTRPKVSHEEVVLDSYNSRAYIAGKHTWEPVSIVLRDDAANNLSRLVNLQVQRQLDHRTQLLGATPDVGQAGANYKFTTRIETLDGQTTNKTEEFMLEGCFLQNVDYGQQDYASSEPVQLTLTVRFDNCIQTDFLALAADPNGAGGGR
jgi:hypothetical protein